MRVSLACVNLLSMFVAGPLLAQARRASAFVDVTVVPMDSERVLEHQTVVVQNGRITALGPSDRVAVPAAAARIDGRGKFLLPGLADMHTHLSRFSPDHMDRALFLLLANGITTIRDVEFLPKTTVAPGAGYSFSFVQNDGLEMKRINDEILAGKRWGPRMYLSSAWRRDSTKSITQNVAAYKAMGFDHIKIYLEIYDGDTLTLDSLVRAAHELDVPLVSHGYELVIGGMPSTLRLGLKSIEHLVAYDAMGDPNMAPPDSLQLSEWVAATVRDSIWNCPCSPDFGGPPVLGRGVPGPLELRYGLAEWRKSRVVREDSTLIKFATALTPDTTNRGHWLQHTARVIKALNDAGAGLLLGTDFPVVQIGFSIHRALQGLVDAGLTPYQALLTGTRNVAAYFGTLDSAGTVAVGKRADLILVAGNPLEDIRNTGEIAGVMAGGRWLSRLDIERRLDRFYGPLLTGATDPQHRASELLGGTTDFTRVGP